MYQQVEAYISADGKVTKQTLTIKNINTFSHTSAFSTVTFDRYNLAPICLLLNLGESFSSVHKHVHRFAFQYDKNNGDKVFHLFWHFVSIGTSLFSGYTNRRLVCEVLDHKAFVK